MLEPLLQLRGAETDLMLGIGVFGLSVLSLALSILIAVVLVRGYSRGPGRAGTLWLAVGLILLTTLPELLRIGLPTFTAIGTAGRSVLVSGCELSGLATILWAIYGGGGR
jgi:hypothetical protein